MRFLFICYFAVVASFEAFAQTDSVKTTIKVADTVITKTKKHSAHKATMYSAVLPGLGQAYNRQYWKIPILYAGIGTIAGFIVYTNSIYRENVNNLSLINNYPELYPSSSLQARKQAILNNIDNFRRYRDLNIILGGLTYTLNILDANVSGHLKGFETTDDLSWRISPAIIPVGIGLPAAGFTIKIAFNK
jgi:hypothetical protein